MSEKESGKKGGSRRGILWFFIFAIACVVAFLIVGLVKTCSADHEEKVMEEQLLQEETSMVHQTDSLQLFA